MFWYGAITATATAIPPVISTLTLSNDVEVFVDANAEMISLAALSGLFAGFALVTIGAIGILRCRG